MKWSDRHEKPPKKEWVLLFLKPGIMKSRFRVGKYLPATNHPEHGTFEPERWKLSEGWQLDFHQVQNWTYIDKPDN